jgi:hypothetical protein
MERVKLAHRMMDVIWQYDIWNKMIENEEC